MKSNLQSHCTHTEQDIGIILEEQELGELAVELNLARATVSEHLTRISAILADEAFSALESNYTSPKVISEMINQVQTDAENSDYLHDKEFEKMWDEIKSNIQNENEDSLVDDNSLMISSSEDVISYYEENLTTAQKKEK